MRLDDELVQEGEVFLVRNSCLRFSGATQREREREMMKSIDLW